MSSKPFDASLKDLVELDPPSWLTLGGGRPDEQVELVDADVASWQELFDGTR